MQMYSSTSKVWNIFDHCHLDLLIVFQHRHAMKIISLFTFKHVYCKCTYMIPSGWHITGRITVLISRMNMEEIPERVFLNGNDKFQIKSISRFRIYRLNESLPRDLLRFLGYRY